MSEDQIQKPSPASPTYRSGGLPIDPELQKSCRDAIDCGKKGTRCNGRCSCLNEFMAFAADSWYLKPRNARSRASTSAGRFVVTVHLNGDGSWWPGATSPAKKEKSLGVKTFL